MQQKNKVKIMDMGKNNIFVIYALTLSNFSG